MATLGGPRPVRVVPAADLPVVVRIARRGETVVAVPVGLPTPDVLSLAALVLTGEEFAALHRHLQRAGDALLTSYSPSRAD